MEMVHDLINHDKYTDEAAYTALTCTGCGECIKSCPKALIPMFIFRAGVEKLSEIGKMPSPVSDFTRMLSVIQINQSEAGWIDAVPDFPPPVDVVMFPGCDSIRAPQEIMLHIDILKKMGINFVTLWNEDFCCGFKGYSVNDFEKGDRLAQRLISAVKAFKPKILLLPCGQCYFQFTHTLPKIFSLPFEIKYFAHFLAENFDRVIFSKPINKTVTFHDSCKMARAVKDFESIRELIKKIPGIRLAEMERNREKSICCGGLKNFAYPELTAKVSKERLDQAERVKADLFLTDCTLCYSIFATRENFYSFEVRHYCTVIAEAMGIESREDPYKKILNSEDQNKILKDAKNNIESWGVKANELKTEFESFMRIINRLREETKKVI
jgi:heterodisulfide reductase subunit D